MESLLPVDETVGLNFSQDKLQMARDKTLTVIEEVASLMKPGMNEDEAKLLIIKFQKELGAPKSWHPPQIRFGENTVLAFGKTGIPHVKLQENDIFFFDLGPIFDSHEGDVGRTFWIGQNAEMKRCCTDVKEIWHEVKEVWQKQNSTGNELYQIAQSCAKHRGWVLNLEKANGHRIADFPHAARARGSIEHLKTTPTANRWILEIQIRHPTSPFGAFYEDLLN